MGLILTYTTINNQKLHLDETRVKYHIFKDNIGYVTLRYTCIPENLFEDQTTLKSVTIPNGVTRISSYAFLHCTGLTSVEIPNSVTSIGNDAFNGCKGLTSVEIPSSVIIIGRSAFSFCISLMNIDIPNGVTDLYNFVFESCTNLKSITIPNSVKSIGYATFLDCSNLTKIVIPNSVVLFDHCTFEGCKNLPCYKINRDKRPILAYKGFNVNMTCRGFKYELGQTYHEEKAKLCECGFHACLNPIDVLDYYPNAFEHRFALVELSGEIDFSNLNDLCGNSKIAATDIKIIKELSFNDLISEFNRLNNN